MKTQNLLFFPFLFALGIGLFSCNIGNNGNVNTYQGIPAVVSFDYSTFNVLLGTPLAYPLNCVLAPELSGLNDGDCLFLNQFTVDYDNQPSSNQYYTASNIVSTKVNQSYVEQNDTVLINNSTLPLSIVSGLSSAYFKGKFFVGMTCNDNNPTFRLVYDNKKDQADGTKNLYLLAEPSASGSNSSGVSNIYAFDLSSIVTNDTTVNNVGLYYVKVNLNYLSSMSSDSVPTFSQVSSQSGNPYTIYIFQNQ